MQIWREPFSVYLSKLKRASSFVGKIINFVNWILLNNKRTWFKLSLVLTLSKVSLFKVTRCVIHLYHPFPLSCFTQTLSQWFTLKLNLGQGGMLYWELPLLVSWFWWMPITLLLLLLMLLLFPLLCERATVKHENRETRTAERQARGLVWVEVEGTILGIRSIYI